MARATEQDNGVSYVKLRPLPARPRSGAKGLDAAMAADASTVSWEEMMIGCFEVGFNPKLDLPDMMGVGRRRLE